MTVLGRTLQQLNQYAECDSLTGWTTSAVTLDTSIKRYGDASFKMFGTGASRAAYRDIDLDAAKMYVAAVDVYVVRAVILPNIAVYNKGGFSNGVFKQINPSLLDQWQTVYVKFTGRPSIRLLIGLLSGTDNFDAYFDGADLYEVDTALYNAIGTTITESNIRDYLPHVNGMQSVALPAVIKTGKNLLKPLTEQTITSGHTVSLVDSYTMDLTTNTANGNAYFIVDVLPNTNYTLSINSGAGSTYAIFDNAASLSIISGYATTPRAFNSGANTTIRVYVRNTSTGTVRYSDFMLILGTAADLPLSFEPRNDDYTVGVSDSDGKPLELHGDPISGVYDRLDFTAQTVYRRFKKIMLDGSLPWSYVDDYVGFKRVQLPYTSLPGLVAAVTPSNSLVTKYDGKVITQSDSTITSDRYNTRVPSGVSYLVISISDADSGFGEGYTALDAEVRATLNGWQAKTVDGNGKPTAWRSLLTQADAPTQTLAYVSANKAAGWTGWATLVYQRAQGVEESVTVEGAISMHSGGNLVELAEGVIVRELANPALVAGKYVINDGNTPSTLLKYRSARLLGVYKGVDPAKGTRVNDNFYKNQRFDIQPADFDPSQKYYVTYVATDKQNMTAAATDGRVEYPGNPGSAVSALSQGLADAQTQIAVHKWLLTWDGALLENLRLDVDADKAAFNTHRTAATMDHPPGSVGTDHLGSKIVTAAKLADGAATDVVIGQRTVDDTVALPATTSGTITQILNWFGSMIRRITGEAKSYNAPVRSIRQLYDEKLDKAGGAMTGILSLPQITGTGASLNFHGPTTTYPSGAAAVKVGSLRATSNYSDTTPSSEGVVSASVEINTEGVYKWQGNTLAPVRYNAGVPEIWNGTGWQPVGGIKAVQRGVASMAYDQVQIDITISPVNLSKTFTTFTNSGSAIRVSGGDASREVIKANLINNNTLRITRRNSGINSELPLEFAWEVVESY
ncbi:hypothetical protein [Paenibacillus sp. cl123]|uniref:hypothetical protein n=1 Tax=Paenibacillus sp. cl123 TaxID=1761875 RepID=UPI000883669A|nr:hypothetical protein [Paenibacillus sp. cl123]SDD29536.1 hypothetical protein SAMN04488602_107182 [Paenibacillus sp. cl123]